MITYNAAADTICGEVSFTVTNPTLPAYITNPMVNGKFNLGSSHVMAATNP